MTEENKNPFEQGPYVQVAAFCERVMEEKDGVLSLIRIVDLINHTESGADPPQDLPAFRYPLNLVLILKPGRARGRTEILVTPELPSGEAGPPMTLPMRFDGETRGTNVIGKIDMEWTMEGLYWFNVTISGQLLTRLPVEIRYSRQVTGTTSGRGK